MTDERLLLVKAIQEKLDNSTLTVRVWHPSEPGR